MRGNNNQQKGETTVAGDQLNRVKKGGLTGIIVLQFIAILLMSWKVWQETVWMPLPPWSTFFVGSFCLTITGMMFIHMTRTTDNS